MIIYSARNFRISRAASLRAASAVQSEQPKPGILASLAGSTPQEAYIPLSLIKSNLFSNSFMSKGEHFFSHLADSQVRACMPLDKTRESRPQPLRAPRSPAQAQEKFMSDSDLTSLVTFQSQVAGAKKGWSGIAA
jgi:hypothetical protein